MWSWIVSVLILLCTWVGGAFVAVPLWAKIVLTVLAVLIVVGWFGAKRIRAILQARALEKALVKQAEDQVMNARPDRRGEIIQLQVQMQRGIAALKQSKLGSGGRESALYSLPWYLMIGPPGAGKTTALRHSGLVFPYLDPQGGGAIKGVGGTRNCDWWFTNEAILIDTAGRYATEADDHEEWIAFLGMLKKYRSKKPINGVLAVVGASDIADASEEQIESHASRLRARIDEVMTRLQMVVPVYLVFSKADLIGGFVEFFGDLRKSERAQIWGATFPLSGAEGREPVAAFDAEYERLVEVLHARAVRRIGTERSMEARKKVFQFPMEMRSIQKNLSEFVGAVFRKNSFQETPIFRGVYLTSGTQEGRPMSRVLSGMLRAFNLAPPELTAQLPPIETKSYFVTDVFRRVVFPDQYIGARTKGEQRRQLINRVLFATAALLMATFVVFPSACTFMNNRALIEKTERVVALAGKVNWLDGSSDVVNKVRRFDDVRDQLQLLDQWKTKEPPIDHRWGMYVGNELYEPARTVYVSHLQTAFATPTKAKLEEELRGAGEGGTLTSEYYNAYFTRLKAYLEMCEVERLQVDWAPGPLTDAWGRVLLTNSKTDRDVLRPHVSYYVELMKRGEIQPWKCDATLVTKVRSVLRRMSELDRDYSALIRDANENIAPITRDSIFLTTSFSSYITSKSKPEVVVPGAFTKQGWESYVRDRLDLTRAKELANERWVLGDTVQVSVERMEKQLAELRNRYFANFQKVWAEFLRDLDVRTPASNEEALDELQALSEVPWPYHRLLKTLQENVALEESLEGKARRIAEWEAAGLKGQLAQGAPDAVKRYMGDAGAPPQGPPPRWISDPERAFRPMLDFAFTGGGGSSSAPGGGAHGGGAPGGESSEKGTRLANYQEQTISKLVAVLTDLRDTRGGSAISPKDVTLAFETAMRSTTESINASQSSFTRPLLSPLLKNPIELGYKGSLESIGGEAGANWETEVWKVWKAKLEDGYPFAEGWKDVKLEDYTEFFKPKGGLLFGFHEKHLATNLRRRGSKFIPETRFNHAIGFTDPFLKCYNRGLEFATATFPGEASTEPLIEFEVNLHSVSDTVSEVTFAIDGAARTYKNEPEEWLKVRWPAKDSKEAGGEVRIRGYSGLDEKINRPGPWGLFRLLDAASKIEPAEGKSPKSGALVATWQVRTQGHQGFVKMHLRPLKNENAFVTYLTKNERMFRGYKCPRLLSVGVR